FVGVAVALGVFAGILLPRLVAAERDSGKRSKTVAASKTMPSIVGLSLEEAEQDLGRRGIAYVTNGGDILGVVVPSIWEVCASEPGAGATVRGTVHLHAAFPGACGI